MNRNMLYLVIGLLAVVTSVFAYKLYQDRQTATGVEIKFNNQGISIQKK